RLPPAARTRPTRLAETVYGSSSMLATPFVARPYHTPRAPVESTAAGTACRAATLHAHDARARLPDRRQRGGFSNARGRGAFGAALVVLRGVVLGRAARRRGRASLALCGRP